MGMPLFEKFTEMVEKLPPKGVATAVRLERQMLEDDLAHKRTMPIEDVRSIVAFSNFLENASDDADSITRSPIPIHHIGFYRTTVKRLVEAGELPGEAGALFDRAFSAIGFRKFQAN
jgi:hypothetical protein